MYPHMQPIPFRSVPAPGRDTRFLPFLGVPFLAGIAGGLLGGAALTWAWGRPFYPYGGVYPYGAPPYPYGGAPYPYQPGPYFY